MTFLSHGKKFEAPSGLFYLGLVLAASGMAMVMLNKPKALGGPKPPAAAASSTTPAAK